jgi:hypothetical protein
LFFYCHTQGGKANLNNEEDIIDIILFLIFFAIENVLFKCVRLRRNREKIESERERERNYKIFKNYKTIPYINNKAQIEYSMKLW